MIEIMYGYDMFLGKSMYDSVIESYMLEIMLWLWYASWNMEMYDYVLGAMWWTYDDYGYDMQMIDSEKWWYELFMRMMDDNPKHEL